jgi:hypothetical protein
MRKYLVFIIALLVTTLVVLAEDSGFTSALKSCSSYTESGTVDTSGMKVQSTKQILGWQNNKCVYKRP